MGVERAVTRWYVQQQMLLGQLAQLEAQQVQIEALLPVPTTPDRKGEVGKETIPPQLIELREDLARTQEKLKALGPCPKPMMG